MSPAPLAACWSVVVDRRSAEAAKYRKLYKTARWQRLRRDHLIVEPVCRMCAAAGLANDGSLRSTGEPQTEPRRRFVVCDHVTPHRGDLTVFWAGPFQTLCADHHDVTKQQIEVRGYVAGCDLKGRPLDGDHPWNRSRR